MKREKQIIKVAESLIDPYEMFVDWEYERGLKEGFINGANWADEHPKHDVINNQKVVEKVRNWLENHIYDDKYWTSEGDDLFAGNLIDDICKYLEE